MQIPEHSHLEAICFETCFHQSIGDTPTPPTVLAQLRLEAETPFRATDEIRKAVRDMMRQNGFKPTGRSKPASEYLLRVAGEGQLPSINLAVDCCNVVSLHSGLPISVFDADLARGELQIQVAPAGSEYVFNRSGQTMDIGGLPCVFDQEGPCANGVKDSQRTKTHEGTQRTVSVIWGFQADREYTRRVADWYMSLLGESGTIRRL